MIKKFVLNYIRKYANSGTGEFMEEVMIACHQARQDSIDDQTVPGRIYDVFNVCAKAIPKVVSKKAIDDSKWRKIVARGINVEVREVLQLPTIEEDKEEDLQHYLESKTW